MIGIYARLQPVWEAGEPQSNAIHVWGAGSIGCGSSQDLILFLCKCRMEDLKLSGLEDINDWTIICSFPETQTWPTAAISAFTGIVWTSLNIPLPVCQTEGEKERDAPSDLTMPHCQMLTKCCKNQYHIVVSCQMWNEGQHAVERK